MKKHSADAETVSNTLTSRGRCFTPYKAMCLGVGPVGCQREKINKLSKDECNLTLCQRTHYPVEEEYIRLYISKHLENRMFLAEQFNFVISFYCTLSRVLLSLSTYQSYMEFYM